MDSPVLSLRGGSANDSDGVGGEADSWADDDEEWLIEGVISGS